MHLINEDSIPFGIYNFSANGSTTWFGFAQEIVRCFNPEKLNKIQSIKNFKTLAKRPKYSVLNLKKTENCYKGVTNWHKSVGVMVDSYKSGIS